MTSIDKHLNELWKRKGWAWGLKHFESLHQEFDHDVAVLGATTRSKFERWHREQVRHKRLQPGSHISPQYVIDVLLEGLRVVRGLDNPLVLDLNAEFDRPLRKENRQQRRMREAGAPLVSVDTNAGQHMMRHLDKIEHAQPMFSYVHELADPLHMDPEEVKRILFGHPDEARNTGLLNTATQDPYAHLTPTERLEAMAQEMEKLYAAHSLGGVMFESTPSGNDGQFKERFFQSGKVIDAEGRVIREVSWFDHKPLEIYDELCPVQQQAWYGADKVILAPQSYIRTDVAPYACPPTPAPKDEDR